MVGVHDRRDDGLAHRVVFEEASGEAELVVAERKRCGDDVRTGALPGRRQERRVDIGHGATGRARDDEAVLGAGRDAEQVGQPAADGAGPLLVVRQRRHHREVQPDLGQVRVLPAGLADRIEGARGVGGVGRNEWHGRPVHVPLPVDDLGRRSVVGRVEVARVVRVGGCRRVVEITQRDVRDRLALTGQLVVAVRDRGERRDGVHAGVVQQALRARRQYIVGRDAAGGDGLCVCLRLGLGCRDRRGRRRGRGHRPVRRGVFNVRVGAQRRHRRRHGSGCQVQHERALEAQQRVADRALGRRALRAEIGRVAEQLVCAVDTEPGQGLVELRLVRVRRRRGCRYAVAVDDHDLALAELGGRPASQVGKHLSLGRQRVARRAVGRRERNPAELRAAGVAEHLGHPVGVDGRMAVRQLQVLVRDRGARRGAGPGRRRTCRRRWDDRGRRRGEDRGHDGGAGCRHGGLPSTRWPCQDPARRAAR